MKITPKMLRKTTDGRIFAYTEALAARADMVAVWPDNVDPNFGEPKTGLEMVESKEGQLRTALSEKDRMIITLQGQMDDLVKDNQALNEEVSKLHAYINNLTKPKEAEKPADPERFAKILEAAQYIIATNDPNHFTGLGKIRIEPLETKSGLTDITAAERDAAMEQCK